MKNILFLLFIFFFSIAPTTAQSKLVPCKLVKQSPQNTELVSYYPLTELNNHNKAKEFKIPLEMLLPSRDIFYALDQYEYQEALFLIEEEAKGLYKVIYDQNFNQNFADDSIYYQKEGEERLWNIAMHCQKKKEKKVQTLECTISLKIDKFSDGFEAKAKTLLSYQILAPLPDSLESILFIDLILTRLYVVVSLHQNLEQVPYYLINEPFKIREHYYIFEDFDPFKETIQFKKYGPNEKPIGFRPEHYVDRKRLEQLSSTNLSNVSTNKTWKKDYLLLHFWGTWCAPCRGDFKKLLDMEKRFETSPISLINYCFVLAPNPDQIKKQQKELAELIEQGKVNKEQFTIILGNENPDFCKTAKDFQLGCNPIELLKINSYPTYLLIDKEGKILFRGVFDKKLDSILNQLLNN